MKRANIFFGGTLTSQVQLGAGNLTNRAFTSQLAESFEVAGENCRNYDLRKASRVHCMVEDISKPGPVQAARRRHPAVVLTVGHSTRAQDDFIALLQAHAVKQLADVRTIPRSRHNPQFNRDRIALALEKAGIRYVHMKALGGLRHPLSNSLNTGWRNASFRGYADYMQTPEFAESLHRLMKMAKTKRTAIMCAEAVPWRCHRALIGDALLAHGFRVEEIESLKRTRPHLLTPWARVQGSKITYPPAECRKTRSAQKRKRA